MIEIGTYSMPSESRLGVLSSFFKVFGDSTRLKILFCISENEKCVQDICLELDISQSAVSHQLQILRNNHLVKYRREGKEILYSLDDQHVLSIINIGLLHIKEADDK